MIRPSFPGRVEHRNFFRECLSAAWTTEILSGSFDFAAKRGYAQEDRSEKVCETQSEKLGRGAVNPKEKTPGWLARRGFSLFTFRFPAR